MDSFRRDLDGSDLGTTGCDLPADGSELGMDGWKRPADGCDRGMDGYNRPMDRCDRPRNRLQHGRNCPDLFRNRPFPSPRGSARGPAGPARTATARARVRPCREKYRMGSDSRGTLRLRVRGAVQLARDRPAGGRNRPGELEAAPFPRRAPTLLHRSPLGERGKRPLWALARSPGFQPGVGRSHPFPSPFRGVGTGGRTESDEIRLIEEVAFIEFDPMLA